METLHQILMTAFAAFAFFILIAKIASAVTNDDENDHQIRSIHGYSKVLGEQFKSSMMEKSSSITKSKKKVRFAVDHDEFVVNKAVAGPSETKQVVFEKNDGRMEDDSENDSSKEEFVSDSVVDYDQIKEGKSELADQKPGEGTMIHEENVANCSEDQMRMQLLCDDGIDDAEKEKAGLISEEEDSDDDWEGVERSELEKVFAKATDYSNVKSHRLQSLDGDTQMQMYALHKVATEGPCHEPQPMALKVSARSK